LLLCGDASDTVGGLPRLRFKAPAAAVAAALGGYQILTVSAANVDMIVFLMLWQGKHSPLGSE
jgi:hypothetical protein